MGLHDQKTFEAVASEAETHDDIILEDFIDSYANLTIKAAYAFKHYLKYYEGSKYFLKADDDIFLNVENLYSLLEGAPENKLIGKVAPHNVPIRDISNKWYIPEFLYPINLFPPYLYGFAVIIPGWTILFVLVEKYQNDSSLSGHLVKSIYDTAMQIPFHTIDDVFFTGDIPVKLLNYGLYHSDAIIISPIPIDDPCDFK